jgi:hypothetical protein
LQFIFALNYRIFNSIILLYPTILSQMGYQNNEIGYYLIYSLVTNIVTNIFIVKKRIIFLIFNGLGNINI